jgi:hypothetical protein
VRKLRCTWTKPLPILYDSVNPPSSHFVLTILSSLCRLRSSRSL